MSGTSALRSHRSRAGRAGPDDDITRRTLAEDPCPTCGGDVPWAGIGRPEVYCSEACAAQNRTVLGLAREWEASGALVIVSEAVPLPLDGWHEVRLTDREVLTCSAPPVRRPAEQQRLQWVA